MCIVNQDKIPSGFAVEDEPWSSDAPLLGEANPELDVWGVDELLDDDNTRPSCSATSVWSCWWT